MKIVPSFQWGDQGPAKLILSSFLEKAGGLSLTYSMTTGSIIHSVMHQRVSQFLLNAREYTPLFSQSGSSLTVEPYSKPNAVYCDLRMMEYMLGT